MNQAKAPNNRTICLTAQELKKYKAQLLKLKKKVTLAEIMNKTICQDIFEVLAYLPNNFIDLVFVDPPYNINKKFNNLDFKEMKTKNYEQWLDSWINKIVPLLKPTASIYICGDWRSAAAIFNVAAKYFIIQNRITFEREKGRGSKTNWKNNSEDIWFCTNSNNYFFDVEAVKIKRKVLAPYRDDNRQAKDWKKEKDGNFRMTYPSNIWSDLTIPFWSMPENTMHPTQKPEKLLAKIILASSKKNDLVFDPFLGSGTSSVVAKKLQRNFLGVELDETYCCLAEKRLELANTDKTIQGYENGIFLDRNNLNFTQFYF